MKRSLKPQKPYLSWFSHGCLYVRKLILHEKENT